MNNPVVLYVEDDPLSQKVMRLLLTSTMGISRFTIWEDSSDFARRIATLTPKPDLVLLDIHVPPHNGFEMLKMLRAMPEFADTPIVALTASVMNEEVQKLREAGFHSVIAKPISLETFPDVMRRILNGEHIWRVG